MSDAGFGLVAELPFIVDSRPGYHRLGSRYLIDRGLGVWNPVTRGKAPRPWRPTRRAMHNYAHWLVNFLEWAQAREVNLQSCCYIQHLQQGYQEEMLCGTWSVSGQGLRPSTVNYRVQQACDFLTWMSDKGLRDAFDVSTQNLRVRVDSATGPAGYRIKEVISRLGKVRQSKHRLRMPTDQEVIAWLSSVYKNSGEALGLACETILLTGLRLQETVSLRMDTLPDDRREWHFTNPDAPISDQQVLVRVSFGAKGPDYGLENGDKVGPERRILIPYVLAEKWDDYRCRKRNPALKLWINDAKSLAERKDRISGAVHLFRNERTGARLTADNLYRAWKKAVLPFPNWSPHLGRDWWACKTLLREVERHEYLRKYGHSVASELIESSGRTIIQMRIQPQLGHKQEGTCLIYLQWVMDRMGVALSLPYEAALEE